MINNRINALLTTVAILVFSGCVNAQSNLQEFLEEGVKNYPGIKAKLAEKESAEQDVDAAIAEYIPRVTGQHQYTYGTSNSLAGSFYPNPAVISPSGGIRAENSNQATWGSYTSVLLEWNIFHFGKVSGNVNAYRKAKDASAANYENEVLQHRVKIADAYLLTLMYDKLVTIQQANLSRAQTFHDVVNAGVSSGMRAGVDSSLASAELAKAKLQLLQSQRDRKAQFLRLFELTATTTHEKTHVDSMYFLTTLPVASDTSTTSNAVNPLLTFYRLRMETSQARTTAIKRSFLPSITLVGAAWTRTSGISPVDDSYHTTFADGTKYRVQNYLLGISTRWTISDFVSIRKRQRSEYYRSIRDQEIFNEQSIRLDRQSTEAEMQYHVSLEQAYTAPIQLKAAQDAYRQANARYQSGLSDLPTLTQSIVTLNRAEADIAVAYVNVWRSLLAIAAAKGDFSIFMNVVNRQ